MSRSSREGRIVGLGQGRLRRTLSRPLAQRRRWVEVTDASTQAELAVRSALHRRAFDFAEHWIRAGGLLSVRTQSSHVGESRSLSMDASGTDAKFTVLLRNRMLILGPKLAANRERDRRVDEELTAHGWLVLRCWSTIS